MLVELGLFQECPRCSDRKRCSRKSLYFGIKYYQKRGYGRALLGWRWPRSYWRAERKREMNSIQDDGLEYLLHYTGSTDQTYEILEAEAAAERQDFGSSEVKERDADDFVDIKLLRRIDAFVDEIQESVEPAFYVDAEQAKPKLKRGKLAKYFGLLSHYYPTRLLAGYGVRAKLFYEVLEELALENGRPHSPWAINEHGQPWWSAFNDFVDLIRERALRGSFREALRRALETSRYQERLLNEHLDRTLAACAKLCVLRLDFALRAHSCRGAGAQQALSELRREFGRFLNNRRHNKIFKHLVSYAWKAELSRRDGPHFHTLFYFDGSQVRADGKLAGLIGAYWQKLVGKDRARFHTSNYSASKLNFHELAIGEVTYDDQRKIRALRNLFTYFAKPEQGIRAITETDRAISVGAVRGRKSNAGRPRGRASVLPAVSSGQDAGIDQSTEGGQDAMERFTPR